MASVQLDYDRFLVDQLVRPIANLYRVTPLAGGETPAGPPVAYVRQRKLAIREDIRFYADEGETSETRTPCALGVVSSHGTSLYPGCLAGW